MFEIGFGVLLFFVVFLFSHYYESNPPQSQIIVVAGLLVGIFVWFFLVELLTLPTHIAPKSSLYYLTGGILVYCLCVKWLGRESMQNSVSARWGFFLGSVALYAILLIVFVQTNLVQLQ